MNFRLKFTLKYINYILFSKHRKGHGIHSPFIFKLITQTFNTKNINHDLEKVIQTHRKYKKLNLILFILIYKLINLKIFLYFFDIPYIFHQQVFHHQQ